MISDNNPSYICLQYLNYSLIKHVENVSEDVYNKLTTLFILPREEFQFYEKDMQKITD